MKKLLVFLSLAFIASWGVYSYISPEDNSDSKPNPNSGGETTSYDFSREAFTKVAPNVPIEEVRKFTFGNKMFNTNWVIAPASVTSLDGLGPMFNRVSCSGCHFKDGRGRPPESTDEPMNSMLIRLSVVGKDNHGGPKPYPIYGLQLNDKSIQGVPAEGSVTIHYTEIGGSFDDGEEYSLRKPEYVFTDGGFEDLEEDTLFSPRVAPAVFGMGLLEAISEETIASFADPEDKNMDGISGKANQVWDAIKQKKVVGRFGWKANEPNVMQQAAGAANGDIGITTSIFPKENCAEVQKACKKAVSGGDPEMSDEQLDKLTFYLQTLAVPARRNVDAPVVINGEMIFNKIGCASCHRSKIRTGEHKVAAISNQLINPYTDLLLHDMGDGLADKRPDFEADGKEWRTAPLWGIGLIKTVNKHTYLLHDGRARNLKEAILWHGGEAEKAKEKFRKLKKEDREALIKFLESL